MPIVDVRMFEEQTEGTESFVGVWLKKLGERVQANEPVVEISTDKVSMEIAAPASGVLTEVLKAENEQVQPGEVLGRIETDGEERTAPRQEVRSEKVDHSTASVERLTPAIRKLLEEHHLEPHQIPATGRGGRLTHQDVTDFIANGSQVDKPESRMVPHTPMRRTIANHMARSVAAAPHVTSVFEADLSRVLEHREARKQNGAASITAYLIQAAVKALAAVPEVNSRWHDDALEIFTDRNIGIGTATPDGGLVVPVIRRAQDLSLEEIAHRLSDLTQKARAAKLARDDIEGATFTISNHGVSGSLVAAPIIIPVGQTAILGVGRLEKRAVVVEENGADVIRARPMMYVTLTVDHRALDAQQTNAFLTQFVAAIQRA